MRLSARPIVAALLMLVLTGCGGGASSPATTPSEATASSSSTASGPATVPVGTILKGQVVFRTVMVMPDSLRDTVVQNRDTIEAQGHIVAADGSTVAWPDLNASGWSVSYDGNSVVTGPDGTFEVSKGPSVTGQISHPADSTYVRTFTVNELSLPGQTPDPIVVYDVYGGPCHMNLLDGDECHYLNKAPGKTAAVIDTLHEDPDPLRSGPLGTYATQNVAKCELTDGPIQAGGGILSYFGSTCDKRVLEGVCPNENRASDAERFFTVLDKLVLPKAVINYLWGASDIGGVGSALEVGPRTPCYLNHKGRECQGVVAGDIALQTPVGIVKAGQNQTVLVHAGDHVTVTVHNNGAFGLTVLQRIKGFSLGGAFDLTNYYDGSQIHHWNAAELSSYVSNHLTGIDRKIYVTDQFMTYTVPTDAAGGQSDSYAFSADRVQIGLTFRVVVTPSPSPSPVSTPSESPSPDASPLPSPSSSPSPSPSTSPNPSVSPSPVPSPSPQVLTILPGDPSIRPTDPIAFSASGGAGGYRWSLTANPSGGAINPSTGAYVAGAVGNVTDVVALQDSLGATTSTNVHIGAARGTITEFPVASPGTNPFSIVSGPGNQLWYSQSGTASASVGSMTPAGIATYFATDLIDQNFYPESIAAGPDGNIWAVGEKYDTPSGAAVARITPSGGMTVFPLPPPASPYDTRQVLYITSSSDGNLYFPEYVYDSTFQNQTRPQFMGKITPSGQFSEVPAPTNLTGSAMPLEGPDGNIWFAHGDVFNNLGTPVYRGSISVLKNGVVTTFPAINPVTQQGITILAITVGPDLNFWFTGRHQATAAELGRPPLPTDRPTRSIGMMTPAGVFTEFSIPQPASTFNSTPSWIAAGPDGNLWFTDSFDNKIGRITPTGVVTEFDIPTPNARPAIITFGPDGNLWFSELNTNNVGRVEP